MTGENNVKIIFDSIASMADTYQKHRPLISTDH